MAGVELATAYVNLVYQDNIRAAAGRELDAVERDAKSSGKRVGASLGGGIKSAMSAAGGLLAAAGVTSFVKDSIAGARESAKVAAITENAVRATGGAAKISASQVGDLAAAISKKTGIDDEAIQSNANLLLTFKNVRNEVGAGNDIFNQATAAAQDLSKAGFGSADSAAKMLGKALNDPIKGMSALGRAGVTFTEAQKQQVAAMVEAGDVLGAQKIIMAEVQSQVGGAAEATATAGDKAAVAFGNLQEAVGAKLLPVVDQAAVGLADFIAGMEDGTGAGGTFAGILGTVWSAGESVVGFLQKYSDILVPLGVGIGAILAAQKAWTIATGIATAAQTLFNAVLAANPIGLVVLALVGLTAAIVTAYKKSETFRDIVNGAWTIISEGAEWMWNGVLKPTFKFLLKAFLAVADGILSGAAKAFGWVPGIGGKLKSAAAKFDEFKKDVNASLAGLDNKTVNVGVQFKAGTKLAYDYRHQGLYTGGHVRLADGGVMPGFTPGRDVHRFYSPTGGVLDLSGGEPVLRPEAGRVLGTDWVDGINAAARSGGTAGVRRWLGLATGGVIPRAWLPSRATVWRATDEGSLGAMAPQLAKFAAEGGGVGGGPRYTGGGNPGIRGDIIGLVSSFLARLGAWNQALGGRYWVNSGYRSVEEQWRLWNASDKTGRMVAYPGRSRHNAGTAADLAPSTTPAHRALARAFGLYFPMSYEPWHIQPLARGGIVKPFVADAGVTLAPGINVVNNKLGKPEPLARTDQPMRLDRWTIEQLADAMASRPNVISSDSVGRASVSYAGSRRR